MNYAVLHAAWAFWRTKHLARTLRTREDLRQWQEKRLERFLRRTVPRVPFYAGGSLEHLSDLPIIDKTIVLANFGALNTRSVSLDESRVALDRGHERVHGLVVGQSTGTSGNRENRGPSPISVEDLVIRHLCVNSTSRPPVSRDHTPKLFP
jgi:phenylacetate-coenzyme A ligase PaaK-like adenylate-forming protein